MNFLKNLPQLISQSWGITQPQHFITSSLESYWTYLLKNYIYILQKKKQKLVDNILATNFGFVPDCSIVVPQLGQPEKKQNFNASHHWSLVGNLLMTGGFPSQKVNNVEIISMPPHHHARIKCHGMNSAYYNSGSCAYVYLGNQSWAIKNWVMFVPDINASRDNFTKAISIYLILGQR